MQVKTVPNRSGTGKDIQASPSVAVFDFRPAWGCLLFFRKNTTNNYMADIVLSKQSTTDEIKAYFNFVVRIVETGKEEYPINLNDVWALVYGRKSDAVEALTKDFIQDVDYQVLRQNPQNPLGGRPTNDYHLTASCFEYFIARKVRPVFEVYRQVFHGVVQQRLQVPTTLPEALRLAADKAEEAMRYKELSEQKDGVIARLKPKADFADTAFTSDTLISISQAAKILKLPFGRNTLFKKLRESGIFFGNKNEPKQRFVDAGYFRMTEGNPIETSKGLMIPVTVYCTQKGLAYINFKFGNRQTNIPQLAKIG